MKGDFSRLLFPSKKNYTSVLQQQGRVALDADANQQALIDDYLRSVFTTDTLGRAGGPAHDEGFRISVSNNTIRIGKGRYYVEGFLCFNEHDRSYTNQPFLCDEAIPSSETDSALLNSLQSGSISGIQVSLNVWQRMVTALDDPSLLEPALNQADTTTRLQTVWQVVATGLTSFQTQSLSGTVTVTMGSATVTTADGFTSDIEAGQQLIFASDTTQTPCEIASISSATSFTLTAAYTGASATTTASLVSGDSNCCGCSAQPAPPPSTPPGKMSAQTGGSSADCSCEPTPAAGYRGLENQLYRVEIHEAGDESSATFKWSRENAFVVVPVTTAPSGSMVWVDSIGMDANLGFAVNDWVEFTDDSDQFGLPPNQPGGLYQIQAITPGSGTWCLTMDRSVSVNPNLNARMRRWDQFGSSATSSGAALSTAPVTLENGIEIQFTPGNYNSGDYWLIPARSATGTIEWPPAGSDGGVFLRPHYTHIYTAPLAIIEWNSTTSSISVEDCRVAITPLGENDLAFHNKHLHGWGIVCGLKVKCGSNRTAVTIKKGYAIDCSGRDIRIQCDVPLNLVSMAQSQSLLDSTGTGDVSLLLRNDGSFAIEAEDKSREGLASFFKGTIWVDFWDKCIEPLINFVKTQFSTAPTSATQPISPGQERLDTFINLLYQVLNPQNDQYPFISIEEDEILSSFYAGLKQALSSCTFCGLFDNARPYPAYPFTALNIHSLFSKGLHTRIRINPAGTYAYTVGADNAIHVYDLRQGVVTAIATFPSQSSAVVQDVALSQDGTQLCAIAQVGSNTAVAWANTANGTLSWTTNNNENLGQVQVLSNVQLVTLATNQSMLYAVGTGSNGGFYAVKFGSAFPAAPTVSYIDNAQLVPFGHLVIDSVAQIAYLTATSPGSTAYDAIVAQQLRSTEWTSFFLNYQGANYTGSQGDDIAVAVSPTGAPALYVGVDVSSEKQLLVFTDVNLAAKSQTLMINLEQDSPFSLAYNPANAALVVAFESVIQIGVVDTTKNELTTVDVPSEIAPGSVVISPGIDQTSQTVYVLNVANSTVQAIPAALLDTAPTSTVSLSELATYRDDAIDAFADLLGLAAQSLKDCFCDLFLIDCPECSASDKIYLGCIEIRDNEVYRICNLSGRQYVKSFPTYGYWLSLIPVLPIAKWLIEKLCCLALPDRISGYQAGVVDPSRNYAVSSDQIISARNYVANFNLTNLVSSQTTKLSTVSKVAGSSISNKIFTGQSAVTAQVDQTEIVNQQSAAVTQRFAAANITVDAVEPYDPSAAGSNITAILGAPTSVPAGSHVVLYEQNGVVKYYTLTPKLTVAEQNLTTQVQAAQTTLTSLNKAQQTTLSSLAQAQQLIASQQATITSHEQEIASLQASITAMQAAQTTRDQEFATLQATVQRLASPPAKS
jgi:Family of unknown function (DUF6519)